jgi:hypothetical protein
MLSYGLKEDVEEAHAIIDAFQKAEREQANRKRETEAYTKPWGGIKHIFDFICVL